MMVFVWIKWNLMEITTLDSRERKKLNKSKIIYRHTYEKTVASSYEYVCRWKCVPWILIIWSFHAVGYRCCCCCIVHLHSLFWLCIATHFINGLIAIFCSSDAPSEWWFYGNGQRIKHEIDWEMEKQKQKRKKRKKEKWIL